MLILPTRPREVRFVVTFMATVWTLAALGAIAAPVSSDPWLKAHHIAWVSALS